MHGNAHLGERHHRHGRVIETDDRYIQSRRCVLEPQPATPERAVDSNLVTDKAAAYGGVNELNNR
jgi:hypothetical protein